MPQAKNPCQLAGIFRLTVIAELNNTDVPDLYHFDRLNDRFCMWSLNLPKRRYLSLHFAKLNDRLDVAAEPAEVTR